MTQDDKKRAAATAALEWLKPGWVVGVGTGSTANHFIDGLAGWKDRIEGAVASSERSAERLRAAGVRLLDLNDVDSLPIYVDGADEATRDRDLIKGGGGALTREKIVASASELFLCIIDDSKLVERLGSFPLPVEVLPLARRQVEIQIERLGGTAVLREGFTTDNGNLILDVRGLKISAPGSLESRLARIPGIVENGLFSLRRADQLIVGGDPGVTVID